MTQFEIRDIKGNWIRAKFSRSDVKPDDEIACCLLLAIEVRNRKLPGDASRYYLKAMHPRKGWLEYRTDPSGGG